MVSVDDYKVRLSHVFAQMSPQAFKAFAAQIPAGYTSEQASHWMMRNMPSFSSLAPGSDYVQEARTGVGFVTWPLYYAFKGATGELSINFTDQKIEKAATILAETDKELHSFLGFGWLRDSIAAISMCIKTGKWGDFSKNYKTASLVRAAETNLAKFMKNGFSEAEAILQTGVRFSGGQLQILDAPMYLTQEERVAYRRDLKEVDWLHEPGKEPSLFQKITPVSVLTAMVTGNALVATTATFGRTMANVTGVSRLGGLMPAGTAAAAAATEATAVAQATSKWSNILRTTARGMGVVGGGGIAFFDIKDGISAIKECRTTSGAFGTAIGVVEGASTAALFVPGKGWIVGSVGLVGSGTLKFVVNDLFKLTDIYGTHGMNAVEDLYKSKHVNPEVHTRLSYYDVYRAIKDKEGVVYRYLQTMYGEDLAIIEADVNRVVGLMPSRRRSNSAPNPSDAYKLPESLVTKIHKAAVTVQDEAALPHLAQHYKEQLAFITAPAEARGSVYRIQDVIADLEKGRQGQLYHHLKNNVGLTEQEIAVVLQDAINQRNVAELRFKGNKTTETVDFSYIVSTNIDRRNGANSQTILAKGLSFPLASQEQIEKYEKQLHAQASKILADSRKHYGTCEKPNPIQSEAPAPHIDIPAPHANLAPDVPAVRAPASFSDQDALAALQLIRPDGVKTGTIESAALPMVSQAFYKPAIVAGAVVDVKDVKDMKVAGVVYSDGHSGQQRPDATPARMVTRSDVIGTVTMILA